MEWRWWASVSVVMLVVWRGHRCDEPCWKDAGRAFGVAVKDCWRKAAEATDLPRSERAGSANWATVALDTLGDVFDTHAIRISLRDTVTDQARRRRKNHMFPLMMFGIFGLGMILIPMGFKFLAVLGGKALLLAKMALLLSSIQGLKKVATSGIGYGLYHAPATNPWYDRKAEDIEASYRLEDGYLNQYPEPLLDYNRYHHT